MSIPAIITQSLSQYEHSSDYEAPEFIERENVNDEERICSILMSDDLGRAQVLYPADRILNVDELNAVMGRSLRVVKQQDQERLLEQYQLRSLPAIPDITGIPSIIDNSIMANDSEYAYVDVGEPTQFVRIKRALLGEMLVKSQQGHFTKRISEIARHDAPDQDRSEIINAIEKFTTMRIKQRIEDTLELPPLPQSAQEIIRLRSDPDAGSDELSTIVEKDPSLAAQVVSWASSSFYSAPGNVKSVHDAIIRVLGFDLVMNLSMGLSLGRTLNQPSDSPEGYTPYWKKALWMALGSTALISKIKPDLRPSFGMAYLAGLLHNIGYLVMAHIFPPHHELICRCREANPHVDPSIIEAFCVDLTSEQMGSMLMHAWSLPEEVVTAIRHQKNPNYDGPHAQYARALLLTQYLLGKHGIIPQTFNESPGSLFEYFHLDEEEVDQTFINLLGDQQEVDSMAGMMAG